MRAKIIAGAIIALLMVSICAATTTPIKYYRYYPQGGTEAQDPATDILTIEAVNESKPTYIKLEYYIGNNTLLITQYNIENATIYYERAVNEIYGGGDSGFLDTVITRDLTVKVYGDAGSKNLTIHELPKSPASITHNGHAANFTVIGQPCGESCLKLSVNPLGIYIIQFATNDTGDGGAGFTEDEQEALAALNALLNGCCCLIAIIICLIIISWLFKRRR